MSASPSVETRARIAAAALQLLREKGASGLSMRQVAARSGLSLSNVQYHYGSRERLLIGLTEHHLDLCRDAMEGALGRQGTLTLRGVIEASLLDEAVLEVTPPFRELFALALGEPGVQALLDAHNARFHVELTGLLRGVAPERPEQEVAEVASVLMAAIDGVDRVREATGVSRERMVDRLEAMTLGLLGR